MKIITKLLVTGMMAAFCCSIAKAQINYTNALSGGTLIYSNNFSLGNASVNITNTPATYEAAGLGGSTGTNWIDLLGAANTNAFYANGAVGTPQGDSIVLPFVPQSNLVYVVKATVTFSSSVGSYIGAGFCTQDSIIGGSNDRYSSYGYNWALIVESSENVQGFGGTTQSASTNNVFSKPTGTPHTLSIIMDTTSNSWVESCLMDGVTCIGVAAYGGIYHYATPPTTIKGVGLTQNSGLTTYPNYQWNSFTVSANRLVLLQQPTSTNINAGAAFTNSVIAAGTPPFSYQWYTNGVPISGATNANLVINPVSAGNASTNYYVVITNTYNAVTSSPAAMSVNTSPTFLEQYPVPYVSVFTNYAGANPQFSVVAGGEQPIYYQWFTNGVAIGGQTNAAFTWTNVQIGTISSYCVASNIVGVSTSMVWTASVIADPTAPYPQKVMSLNPAGYWRLNEVNPNESESGDDGFIAYDYINGNDGIYSNVVLSYSSGYSPGTDPGDTAPLFGIISSADSDAFAVQGVNFGTPTNSATFSVEAWVNGGGFSQVNGAGIVSIGPDGNEQFALALTNNDYQFLIHDASGNLYTATASFGPNGNWHHLVGVCDEVNGAVSLYVDGKLASTVPIAAGSGLLSSTNAMVIGARSASTTSGNNLQFSGYLNDVAVFNYALSPAQIDLQYTAVQTLAPYFQQTPPASETLNAGSSLTIPATVLGSMPLGYNWTDVHAGTNVAAGVTNSGLPLNATLTIANVPPAWNGDQLELTVTNSVGSLNVYVLLNVFSNATITANLPAQITLLSGASYTYSVTVAGVPPYAYQWYQAGAALTDQTNSTYIATAGAPGSSTTYYVVVTNIYGAVTSTVSTLISVAQPTNAYSAGISQLSPVGYWPMHEVETPAPGDIETNYGTLGILGAAYYPDWTGNYAAFTRQVSGALAGDPDTALHFNNNLGALGNGAGTWTNEIYIPHTSPLATLNPPFSVECWLLNTNGSVGGSALNQSIWGQFGWEGLNAGPAGGGSGSIRGMQLAYDNDGSIAIYCYTNGTGDTVVTSDGSATTNIWHHVVVTCDANTNFTLYVDGSTPGTVAGVGKYNPDYWTPLCIGGTRGGTRCAIVTVDEFAVYTNALSSSVITTHYNDGISGAAGAYFHDVTNSGAVIYLRMDAPSYTAPQLGSWPELINYGSIGNAGVYTPGTAPGVVAGPAINGTNFIGLSGATNVAALSGVSSFADAGSASAYNPTGSNANFTVAAMFRGNPCDNRVQAIVSHGNNSWQLNINTTGNIVFNAGNGNSPTTGTGQNPGDISSTGVYNDGNWHQVVAINTTNRVSLYVDGALDTSGTPSGTTPTSIIPGNSYDVMVGADPSNTNNPVGVGRQFAGQVCEVAFFNQAMTAAQVQHLYSLAIAGNTVVINPNPTNIVFSVSGNQMTLNWPSDHTGWQLQAQTNGLNLGLSNNWVNVSGSTTTNMVLVPINITNGSVFYRLIYTP